jgi:hypothetical protein
MLAAVVVACLACLVRAGPQGGVRTSTEYTGGTGDARRQFSIVLDRALFPLLSMGGKYRVVRVIVQNGGAAMPLSAEKDTVTATFAPDGGPEKIVKGMINIGQDDPDFWSALTQEQRNALAYPNAVPAPPGGDNAPPTARAIYVFFPAAEVTSLPRNFTYRIDSLGEPIEIRTRPAAAD